MKINITRIKLIPASPKFRQEWNLTALCTVQWCNSFYRPAEQINISVQQIWVSHCWPFNRDLRPCHSVSCRALYHLNSHKSHCHTYCTNHNQFCTVLMAPCSEYLLLSPLGLVKTLGFLFMHLREAGVYCSTKVWAIYINSLCAPPFLCWSMSLTHLLKLYYKKTEPTTVHMNL